MTQTRQMRALIVENGTTLGALPGARALAAAGFVVGLGSPQRSGLAYWSKATTAWDEVPAVEAGLDAFLAATADAVKRQRADVVFCAGDAEALALAYGSDRIPTCVPFPAYDVTRRAFDKLHLTEAAVRGGLNSPRTVPATEGDLTSFDGGPVIVKARLHWSPEQAPSSARMEVQLCQDAAQARAAIARVESCDGVPVLQEVVRGGTPFNVHSVIDRAGTLLAAVATSGPSHFWPPHAGRRTRAEVVPLDPALERAVAATLVEMGWYGFSSMEFLVDEGGRAFFVDFNGRIPLTLDCTILAAGINAMELWANVALGQPAARAANPRIGARYHWLTGDLSRAVFERQGGIVRDVAETLRYALGAHHTMLQVRDPAPTLRRGARHVGQLLGRVGSNWQR